MPGDSAQTLIEDLEPPHDPTYIPDGIDLEDDLLEPELVSLNRVYSWKYRGYSDTYSAYSSMYVLYAHSYVHLWATAMYRRYCYMNRPWYSYIYRSSAIVQCVQLMYVCTAMFTGCRAMCTGGGDSSMCGVHSCNFSRHQELHSS